MATAAQLSTATNIPDDSRHIGLERQLSERCSFAFFCRERADLERETETDRQSRERERERERES